MNKEEIEAIAELKEQIKQDKEELPYSEESLQYKQIILNLIDKLQKELQREKNRIMELAEMLDKKDKEIKFLETELEFERK